MSEHNEEKLRLLRIFEKNSGSHVSFFRRVNTLYLFDALMELVDADLGDVFSGNVNVDLYGIIRNNLQHPDVQAFFLLSIKIAPEKLSSKEEETLQWAFSELSKHF